MTLFKAELKHYLRSPIIYLIMALIAFVSAWSFLLSIELFSLMQIKFAGMSDAPTILQGIIYPVISANAKILVIIISIIGGLSFSRLLNNNAWSLVLNAQYSDNKIILQKYLAVLLVVFVFVSPALLAVCALTLLANVHLLPVLMALIGFLLLLMWMLAIAMFVSSLVDNTGFAILLCIVLFMLLWVFSQASLGEDWGKNWVQVISPFYHFQRFSSNTIVYASLFYFVVGTILALLATKARLMHKRYSL